MPELETHTPAMVAAVNPGITSPHPLITSLTLPASTPLIDTDL